MPSTRHGRRSGSDRRVFAVYYRHRSERRENPDRRQLDCAGEPGRPDAGNELWREYWGASDESPGAE